MWNANNISSHSIYVCTYTYNHSLERQTTSSLVENHTENKKR